jgi:hypothetical protein
MPRRLSNDEMLKGNIAELQGQLNSAYKRIEALNRENTILKRKLDRAMSNGLCYHDDEEFCVVCNVTIQGEELNL